MPTPIAFKITTAGEAAAIAADSNALQLQITHVALGAGAYNPTGAETALVDRREKAVISAGGVPAAGQLSLAATFSTYAGAAYNMGEIGLYAGDPDAGGVLFAVASQSGVTLAVRNSSIAYTPQFTIAVSGVPSGSVTVVVDSEGGVSAALIAEHLAAANPHPQYVLVAESHEVGDLVMKYRATAPARWPECAGQEVSRATYPLLYAHAIAEGLLVTEVAWPNDKGKFGEGDGSTTFRMPDLRGQFLRAWAHGGGVDAGRALASTQDWATGRPKTTDAVAVTDSGTRTPVGNNGASLGTEINPSQIGFVRASKATNNVTASGADATGGGLEMDVINVIAGDAETRPRNVAAMVCMYAGRAP